VVVVQAAAVMTAHVMVMNVTRVMPGRSEG
jgi:hypothetical protein